MLKLLAFKPQTNDPSVLATAGTYFPVRDGAALTVKGQPAFVEGTPPAIFDVQNYIDTALDSYSATSKAVAANNIASGVAATVPAAAGAVIAGYVQDLKTSVPATTDADVINFLKHGTPATPVSGATPAQAAVPGPVVNAKLAAAVSDIVADTFRLLSPSSYTSDAVSLATSTAAGPGVAAYTVSPTLKGKIASGALRAVPSDANAAANATAIVGGILGIADGTGKAVPQTGAGLTAFAGAASQGIGGNPVVASAVSQKVIDQYLLHPAATVALDMVQLQNIAIAVSKSVGLVNADAAAAVAKSLFSTVRSGTNVYNTANAAALAGAMAKGLATSYSAAGAAVAGVVNADFAASTPPSGDLRLRDRRFDRWCRG